MKASSGSAVCVCKTKAPRRPIARADFSAAVSSGYSVMLSRQPSLTNRYWDLIDPPHLATISNAAACSPARSSSFMSAHLEVNVSLEQLKWAICDEPLSPGATQHRQRDAYHQCALTARGTGDAPPIRRMGAGTVLRILGTFQPWHVSSPKSSERGTVPDSSSNPLELLKSNSYLVLLALAALIGLPVAVIAYFFLELVAWLQHELFQRLPIGLGFTGTPAWWPLPLLALSGLLVGLCIRYLPGRGGHSPADGFKVGGGPPPIIDLPGIALAADRKSVV